MIKNDIINIKKNIKIGYLYRKKIVKIKYNKNIYNLLKIFYKEGYIYKFNIKYCLLSNKKYINIFLKYYNNIPIINNIISYNFNKKKVYNNNYKMSKISNNNELLLISNTFGIISLKECLLNKEGGILISKIF